MFTGISGLSFVYLSKKSWLLVLWNKRTVRGVRVPAAPSLLPAQTPPHLASLRHCQPRCLLHQWIYIQSAQYTLSNCREKKPKHEAWHQFWMLTMRVSLTARDRLLTSLDLSCCGLTSHMGCSAPPLTVLNTDRRVRNREVGFYWQSLPKCVFSLLYTHRFTLNDLIIIFLV